MVLIIGNTMEHVIKLKEVVYDFLKKHRDKIEMILILVIGSTLIMTLGFAIYKLIVFLSDFIIIGLLIYVCYLLKQISGKMNKEEENSDKYN